MAGKKLLSICIPTYNRPLRIKNSLENYAQILTDAGMKEKIEICISDNSTNDETRNIVEKFTNEHSIDLAYSKNEKNLGFDKNVANVLSMGSGEYLHLVSDEDVYLGNVLKELMWLLEHTIPDCILLYAHLARYIKFKDRITTIRNQEKGDALRRMFSSKRKGMMFFGLLSCAIIRKSDFSSFRNAIGPEAWFGSGYMHVPIYLYCLKNSKTTSFYSEMFRRRENVSNSSTPLVVAFPSEQMGLICANYYDAVKKCHENGIISSSEFDLFRKNYLNFVLAFVPESRTYLYPEIYPEEANKIAAILDKFILNYNLNSIQKMLFHAYVWLFYNPWIPYHLAYSAWAYYRRNIKGNKDVMDAHEAYRSFLSGKKKFDRLGERTYEGGV